jgi:hypothetical protein
MSDTGINLSRNSSARTRLAARKAGLISGSEYTSPARRADLPNNVQEETDIM